MKPLKRLAQQRVNRGQWTEEVMQIAIQSIKTGERSIRNAAKFYSIPASSIGDWLNGKTTTKRLGHGTYLTEVEERELKTWAFRMQEVAFCVTLPILKNTVREIIRKFPRVHPFKDDLPGQKWWERFKCRHPDVVLRCGEGLEMKRSMGLNHKTCSRFYEFLGTIFTAHEYQASHVWNSDETGVQSTGRNSTLKVVAKRGSKHVNVSSSDNREWMTTMVCVSASGTFIPHYYIFKGTYLQQDYVKLCEPGAVMNAQEKGWITSEFFCDWLHHFKSTVPGGVNKKNKHLLILDGHSSHVSATALDICIQSGIDVMTIRAHTSHRMQPLDVSYFKPFKQYLQEEKAHLTMSNPSWGNGCMLKSTLAQMVSQAL
jgi:hypothetical protein